MSFIERDGEILPDYTDIFNGNAPHMPGYDRVIPHDEFRTASELANENAGIRPPLSGAVEIMPVAEDRTSIDEIEAKLDGGQALTAAEATLLNRQNRGNGPTYPRRVVEKPGQGRNHTW